MQYSIILFSGLLDCQIYSFVTMTIIIARERLALTMFGLKQHEAENINYKATIFNKKITRKRS